MSANEDQEFSVPYHFHNHHEFIRVTRGYLDATLDGKTIRVTPEMEALHIKPGVKHKIHKPKGVWTEASEESLPGQEEVVHFFRDLLVNGPVRRTQS